MRFLSLQMAMIFITVFFNQLRAQDYIGLVQSVDGTPIAGVLIRFENEVIAKTNAKGQFSLSEKIQFPIHLSFKHADYQSKNQLFYETNQVFFLQKLSDIEELDQITVVASSDVKKTIILPISQVTSKALEQQTQVTLVDAMNKIPGVYIQSGAINTNRITIRGVGSRTLYGTNKIKAYFNDIPITNGIGETVLDIYDVEDLQSIEIIKGPKASLYGTSFGGIILLTSKKPENQGFSTQNSSTIGSFGLFKNRFAVGFSDEKFSLHFNYGHLEMDGFRENSAYQINSYVLNSTYKFDEKTSISLLFNHSNYLAQLPSSIGKTDFMENPKKAAFTWLMAKGYKKDKQLLAGINVKHKFSDYFENNTSVFYSYSDHYEPRPFNILDEFTNGYGLRSVFTKTFNFLGRNAKWNFGTELFKDEYQWKTIENKYQSNNGKGSLEGMLLSKNSEKRTHSNFFSDITLSLLEKLNLQLGINFNDTSYHFKDEFNAETQNTSASRNFDPLIAPNLNLTYQILPNLQVFANASYGFNFPSLEEALTPEGVVNPEISPEKGFHYEIGTELYFLNRRGHLLTSYYILDIKDLLVAQRVGEDQYIGRNAGRTLHKGVEFSTDYKFILSSNVNLTPFMNASFNWHRFRDFVNEDIDYSGNELTGVPDMVFNYGFALTVDKFSLFANQSYFGKMPMNDANTLYSDAYNLLNLKLDYSTQLFKLLNIKFNFGINNVFDTHYASSILINATGFNNVEPRYYYPGNPRNYYGGIVLNYLF